MGTLADCDVNRHLVENLGVRHFSNRLRVRSAYQEEEKQINDH